MFQGGKQLGVPCSPHGISFRPEILAPQPLGGLDSSLLPSRGGGGVPMHARAFAVFLATFSECSSTDADVLRASVTT